MSTSTDARIGTELAGYRIEALIGRGGMSTVYRAEDLTLGRKVALKLMSPELSEDESFRERFRAEWRLAASIDHPNVIPIHEAGDYEGTLFIAMRYVEGTDLKALLEEEGALEPKWALNFVSQAAAGLDAAHQGGLVHRDIKPSNVLISFDQDGEHAYLTDFGLTKPASSAEEAKTSIELSGSSDYVSPEQISDGTASTSSDIYSLGALLYESLTGVVPYPYERSLAVLFAHLNDPPPKPTEVRPELSALIDDVIAKAMAKEPDDRYASGGELAEAAAAAFPEPRRSRWQLAALIGILALLIAAAAAIPAILLTGGESSPQPRGTTTITTGSVQRIDPERNELVATVEIDAPVSDIAAGDDSVWALGGDSVYEIQPDETVRSISLPSQVAGGGDFAVAAGDVWFWRIRSPRRMTRLDLKSGLFKEFTPTTTFKGSGGATVAATEGSLWHMQAEGASVGFHIVRTNPETGETLAEIPLVREGDPNYLIYGPGVMTVGEGSVWFSNPTTTLTGGEIWRVDPVENALVEVIDVGVLPYFMAVGEGAIWLSDELTDSVVRIDAETAETSTINVGRIPRGIAVGAGAVWVANSRDGTVSRIDPATLDITTITVGGIPEDIAVGEGGVWVTVGPK